MTSSESINLLEQLTEFGDIVYLYSPIYYKGITEDTWMANRRDAQGEVGEKGHSAPYPLCHVTLQEAPCVQLSWSSQNPVLLCVKGGFITIGITDWILGHRCRLNLQQVCLPEGQRVGGASSLFSHKICPPENQPYPEAIQEPVTGVTSLEQKMLLLPRKFQEI